MRINPGPFEPFVYFLQTLASFRIIGIGGLVVFTILFLQIAAAHGALYAILGLILLAALLASWKYTSTGGGIGEHPTTLHAALVAIYILYGLIWMWHHPALGVLFTLWVPFAYLTTTSPAGSSWRAKEAE